MSDTEIMPNGDRQEIDAAQVRGENIIIKITTVCAFLVTFGAAIWWAAQLQADVRGVQRDITTIRQAVQALDKMSVLENEIREIRQYGSLTAQATAKDLDTLRREFEMHKATTMGTKP